MIPEESNPVTSATDREKTIIRVSVTGIVTNALLVLFKATVGFLSNSIAVILDAVNNLTDVLSSLVTIVGAKLGAKKPDRKHPLGHGRIEYLSALIVSGIVMYAGITALIESVKKVMRPEKADYSMVSLIIIAAAVFVKIILGTYVKKQGIRIKSTALKAAGTDALYDAFLSLSVLVSALIYVFSGISLEAYVGVLISIFIIRAGIEMMSETLDDIIGHREDEGICKRIKKILAEEPEVRGAYDLNLFNYGPDKYYGSVHLELPDVMTVEQVDVLTRKVQLTVYRETGVILTGVGVYSYNTTNEEAAKMRNAVLEAVMSHDWALQLHGFYADPEKKTIHFDVVVSFDIDRKEAYDILYKEISGMFPDYDLQIVTDIDVDVDAPD